jgi:hypothetical protein
MYTKIDLSSYGIDINTFTKLKKPNIVNIVMIADKHNIIQHLIKNNATFNYLVEPTEIIEFIPIGYKTNGTMRHSVSVTNNEYVEDITIGIIINDATLFSDLSKSMPILRSLLKDIYTANNIQLKIGSTINFINHNKGDKSLLRSFDPVFVADIVFTFFNDFI